MDAAISPLITAGCLCGVCTDVRVALRVCLCSTRGRKRQFVVWDGGDYYGEYGICLRCGERYGGDGWLDRPFCPGWRKKNIAKAKRMLIGGHAESRR